MNVGESYHHDIAVVNETRWILTAGFLLIEVLVAIFVLSVALLGLAGLQLSSVKNAHSAMMRGQSAMLVGEILEKMRANRSEAISGAYNIVITHDDVVLSNGSHPEPLFDPPENQAQHDLNDWQLSLWKTLALPDLQGQNYPVGSISCQGSDCRISVQWSDFRGEGVRKGKTGLDSLISFTSVVVI